MPAPRKAPKKGARSNQRFLKDRRTRFKPEFIPIAKKMVRAGWTDFRIAEYFDISTSTLSNWKVKEPKLARAMFRAEALLVKQTEASMWERANGYSHDAEEIGYYRGKPIRVKTTKIYPPDVGAGKMMLSAHVPNKYRERLDIGGDASRPVKFIIEGLHPKEANAKPASEPARAAAG